MEKYSDFLYAKRSKDESYHYAKITLDEVDKSKPMIFVFGGSGTATYRQINGYMKMTESVLGVFNDDVTIVGCKYNDFVGEFEEIGVQELVSGCREFADKILIPLAKGENGKLDEESICKNFRRVNIITHCFGDIVQRTILDCAVSELGDLGYSSSEIKKAIEQIFIVSSGSDLISELGTRLCVVSPLDMTVDNNYHGREIMLKNPSSVELNPNDKKKIANFNGESLGKHIMEVSEIFNDNPRVYVVSENNSIYLAASSPFEKHWDDHGMNYIKRENITAPSEDATIVGDYVSKCIMCALCNSVANSILNDKSKEFKPFTVAEIKAQLQEVVKPLNSQNKSEDEKPWFWQTL